MNITAFIIFLFGLQMICLIVGGQSSKGLKNHDDYFLAGKGIRFFPLMMTFLATQVGGGLILGSAEEAYRFGWTVLFYPLGATLGLLLLGLGLGRKLAEFQVSTVAQVLEKVYGVPVLKKIASLLSIVSLFMILVAQIIASNKFMISLGVESKGWFLAFWAIVIIYTAVGGLKAVVATDVIQATFFVGAFLLCFGYIVFSMDTPIASVWHMGLDHEQFAFEPTKLCSWLIMPLLFMVIEQDMGQRCFAAESPQIISKATLWAGGCTLVISVIPVFLGILAKHVGIEIVAGGSVLMTIVTEMTTPVLTAFVACAILAAIISTADSLINAISSNLSQDFGLSFLKHDHIRTSQLLTGGIAITGILFSFYFNNVVDLLIQSYELSVSCLFIPICFALFKKQGSALSATLSIICGIIGFILFRMYPIAIPKEIASVLLSLLGFFIGQLLSYRPGLYVYENK